MAQLVLDKKILENLSLRYKVVGGNNYVLSQTNPKPRLGSACGLTPFPAHPSFEMYKNPLLFSNLLIVTLQCYKLNKWAFLLLWPFQNHS